MGAMIAMAPILLLDAAVLQPYRGTVDGGGAAFR